MGEIMMLSHYGLPVLIAGLFFVYAMVTNATIESLDKRLKQAELNSAGLAQSLLMLKLDYYRNQK
jgi:hypothetical protein